MPLSPIELLLPNGVATRAVVRGGAHPTALVPAKAGEDGLGAVDLVVLAPTPSERRDPVWIREAVRVTAAELSATGIAYVVPARAIRLRRALVSVGIGSAETLLHIPSVAHGRHVVPLGTAAERFALSGQLPMSGLKRLAAHAALRLPGVAALGPTGAVHRRGQAPPLGQWLFGLGEPPGGLGSVLVGMSGAAEAAVLHRFPAGQARPDAVAKVSPRAGDELRALRDIAPGAALAGARVPDVLAAGELGSVQFVLGSALSGRSGALLAHGGRVTAVQLQELITGWLERWARATAARRELGPRDVERFVLAPAAELGSELPGSYVDHLRTLCARAAGETCPVAPCHGDLTVANVLLDGGPLGIVDWEEASPDSLPLLDFFYSAADAVSAENGYANRVGAFTSCFTPGGSHAAVVRSLLRRLTAPLSINATVQELCFHACWLHHAANEARRAPAYPGPFMTILRTIAGDGGRFFFSDSAR